MATTHEIKCIYFDIGGVLVRDFSGTTKWTEMLTDLGFPSEKQILFEKLWNQYTSRVNLDYDIDAFVPIIQKHTDRNLTNYSMLNDFISRFERNEYLSEIARMLTDNYTLGLLTNMYPRMLSSIIDANLLPEITWDSVVDSSVVGVQKPDEEIFVYAEQKVSCMPNEILFVDNKRENLVVPQQRGWQTFLYDPSTPKSSAEELKKTFFL